MSIEEHEGEFERELSRALRPVEAPAGFADRVVLRLELADAPSVAPVLTIRTRPAAWRWMGGALAASLLAGAAGTWAELEHRRRQQREAERQFAVAMQATSHALEQTRQQLSRAGLRFMDSAND